MERKTEGRVLVIGDDMRIFLAIVRALGRAGKRVEAMPFGPSPALASRYLSCLHHAPAFDADPAAWREALLALLSREQFDLVIPCSDPAIVFLDANREGLAHQRLAIPARQAMNCFYDKEQTRLMAERLGIPVAPAHQLTFADTADTLIARYGMPVVLKPRRTFFPGSDQAREIVEIAESREALTRGLAAISDRSRYLAEAFFPGEGVGVSVLASEGRIIQAFQHRRLREGKGGASSFRISEDINPALLEACSRICAETGHSGVCMFEFRHNQASGQWILIETNARFWGSMGLPLALGLDFPNMLYLLMVDGAVPVAGGYKAGVRSRNFMLDGYNLLKELPLLSPGKLPSWAAAVVDFMLQPWRWMTGAERSDSFAADDLAPALLEFGQAARKLPRLILGVSTRRARQAQCPRSNPQSISRACAGRGITTRSSG